MRESSSAACSDGGVSNDGAEKRERSRVPSSASGACSGTSRAPFAVELSGRVCVCGCGKTGAPVDAEAIGGVAVDVDCGC